MAGIVGRSARKEYIKKRMYEMFVGNFGRVEKIVGRKQGIRLTVRKEGDNIIKKML